MKFKNETNETKKIRLDSKESKFGYRWQNLKPGDTIDIPQHYGYAEGLTQIAESKPEVKEKEEPMSVPDTESRKKKYFQDLVSIKGVGKKTAKDIMKVYKTREDLLEAVKNEEDLPFRDDIAKDIKNKL